MRRDQADCRVTRIGRRGRSIRTLLRGRWACAPPRKIWAGVQIFIIVVVTDTKFGDFVLRAESEMLASRRASTHRGGSKERVMRCGALMHGDTATSPDPPTTTCFAYAGMQLAHTRTACLRRHTMQHTHVRREQCSTYGTSTWTRCRSLAHGAHCAWHGAWQHIHCSIDRAERVQLAVEVARRQRTWRVPKRSAGELRLHVCRERRADHGVRWRCGWGGVVPL